MPEIEPTPVVVPEHYSADSNSISDVLDLFEMMLEVERYVETGNTPTLSLDQAVLRSMLENKNGNADGNFSSTFNSSIRIWMMEEQFEKALDVCERLETASTGDVAAAEGVSGRMANATGDEWLLLDENGHALLIELRMLFWADALYRAAVYDRLGDSLVVAENADPATGSTSMQKRWNEAHALLALPEEYPDNVEGARAWGKRAIQLGYSEDLSHAFRRGRASIDVWRYDVRDEERSEIAAQWETLIVASFVAAIDAAMANEDLFKRLQHLTEAAGCRLAIALSTDAELSETQLEDLQDFLGENFYQTTNAQLEQARALVADVYGIQ